MLPPAGMPIANVKGCWYFVYILFCPLCGAEEVVRKTRCPGPRPSNPDERMEISRSWCGCGV